MFLGQVNERANVRRTVQQCTAVIPQGLRRNICIIKRREKLQRDPFISWRFLYFTLNLLILGNAEAFSLMREFFLFLVLAYLNKLMNFFFRWMMITIRELNQMTNFKMALMNPRVVSIFFFLIIIKKISEQKKLFSIKHKFELRKKKSIPLLGKCFLLLG